MPPLLHTREDVFEFVYGNVDEHRHGSTLRHKALHYFTFNKPVHLHESGE